MELSEYQKKTQSTAVYPGKETLQGVLYTALGLAGEAGEVCNKIKKILRDDKGHVSDFTRVRVCDELGDVLWYLAALAHELNADLSVIAENNIAKLANRYANGTLHGSGDAR